VLELVRGGDWLELLWELVCDRNLLSDLRGWATKGT